MKISIYAISKNEAKFAKKWARNVKDADEIIVLDSFSTDHTKEILEQNGVKVIQKKIDPWRFDTARNTSLDYVSADTDICICLDLDEELCTGWRKILESQWTQDTKLASYKYIWSHNADGSEGISFFINKIHARNGFKWINPVHEIICDIQNRKISPTFIEGLKVEHFPDINKPRSSYLPLLELAVQENPQDDRNLHYLGREYMYYARYELSIKTLKKHLALRSATWADERCASLRYIAKCYQALGKHSHAHRYFKLACAQSPYLREPRLSLAEFYLAKKRYLEALLTLQDLLKISERSYTYISLPECWNDYPYELASFCAYKISNLALAIEYAKRGLQLNAKNQKLQNNLSYFLLNLQKTQNKHKNSHE